MNNEVHRTETEQAGGGGHADSEVEDCYVTFEHSCIPHGTNNETV